MFEKITTDIEITQEVQKKQFRITTEDLRRFLASNGEDKELNDKLRIWSKVEKESLTYDEVTKDSKTISVFNIPEPKDTEEDSQIELEKGDKTWKHGQLDENGLEITYKVKQHIFAEPENDRQDYISENKDVLKTKIKEINDMSSFSEDEIDDIINTIQMSKTNKLDSIFQTNNKPKSFISRIKNWFGIK
jgi:hypothetical protein